MQIVAAAVPVHVQHLAAGIEPGHQLAFHGGGVKFPGHNASRCDLGAVHAHWLRQVDGKPLYLLRQLLYLPVCQLCRPAQQRQTAGLDQDPAQTVVENAGQYLPIGQICGPAGLQRTLKLLLGQHRQQIQHAFPVALLPAHVSGHLKYHRPGEAILRKLNFSGAFGPKLPIPEDFPPALRPDALQGRNGGPIRFQLHQGRPQLGAVMAQGP